MTTEGAPHLTLPHLPGSVWYGGLKVYWSYLRYVDSTCQVFFFYIKSRTFLICVAFLAFLNSSMEEVYVGVMCNTLLDSHEGDLTPHTSQTICFSNINENKTSDRETPVELSLELLLIMSMLRNTFT